RPENQEEDMNRRWYGVPITGAVVLTLLSSPSAAAAAGSIWRVVPTPNPGAHKVSNIFFTGVSAASSSDAWAVGVDEINAFRRPLVEHWDGLQWKAVAVPRPPRRQSWFNGVIALSSTDAWAVGESTSAEFDNQEVRTLI